MNFNAILQIHNVDIFNIRMKEFGAKQYSLQNDNYQNFDNF